MMKGLPTNVKITDQTIAELVKLCAGYYQAGLSGSPAEPNALEVRRVLLSESYEDQGFTPQAMGSGRKIWRKPGESMVYVTEQ